MLCLCLISLCCPSSSPPLPAFNTCCSPSLSLPLFLFFAAFFPVLFFCCLALPRSPLCSCCVLHCAAFKTLICFWQGQQSAQVRFVLALRWMIMVCSVSVCLQSLVQKRNTPLPLSLSFSHTRAGCLILLTESFWKMMQHGDSKTDWIHTSFSSD